VESPLRPKEIQARIRAGETVEEIADAAGIAVERVRWFEGPVLAERAYMAQQAQTASVRRPGDPNPGPRLGEIVTERLEAVGSDPEDAQWDAKKRGDGSWLVQLAFTAGDRLHVAEWVFDPRRRHVMPADDNAVRMSLPGAEPPRPAAPPPGEATVTRLAPRLSSASGHHGQGSPPAPAPQRAPLPRTAAQAQDGRNNGDGYPAPARPVVPGTRPAVPEGRPVAAEARPAIPEVAVPEADVPEARPVPAAHQAPAVSPATGTQPAPATPAATPAAAPPASPAPPAASAPAAPAAPAPAAPAPAASAGATGEQPSRQGSGGRKGTRSRRSSVPSWDEIMFGNSRQRD
jgi:hypothetical protein